MALPVDGSSKLLSKEINPSHQTAVVRFTVLDKWYRGSVEFSIKTVTDLLSTCEKASLVFEKVVIARTYLQPQDLETVLKIGMWDHDGPFTADQFLAMLQYDPKLTEDAWINYLNAQVLSFFK